MYRPRIIPVLLLQNGALVKSVRFKNHVYIGDPVNAVKIFNSLKADELIFLDIDNTKKGAVVNLNLLGQIAEEANMPFSVGGGITKLEHIQSIIATGAERVVIGHKAAASPDFIKEASNAFGMSTICVCIDVKKNLLGKDGVYTLNGTQKHQLSPVDFAKQMEQNGAGELIIQSIDKDGTMTGFDIALVKKITDAVHISVVALGGGGNKTHFDELFKQVPLSGIASGSRFVYKDEMKGVLINY